MQTQPVPDNQPGLPSVATLVEQIAEAFFCGQTIHDSIRARVKAYSILASLVQSLVQEFQRNGYAKYVKLAPIIDQLKALNWWDPAQDDDTPSDHESAL